MLDWECALNWGIPITLDIILLKDGVVLTLLSLFIITSSDLFSTGDRRESSQSKNRGSGQKEISRPV